MLSPYALERQRSIVADERARRNARRSLVGFKSFFTPHEIPPQFHNYISERLTKFVAGEIKRLIIVLRPGFGKSDLGSRYLPAFAFGKNPNHRIAGCSYGETLATDMNRDVQRIMTSEEYQQVFPSVTLGTSNVRTIAVQPLRNSEVFDVLHKQGDSISRTGFYRSAGVGGSITGRRFSLGIIDDPVRGAMDADSPVKRDSIWNWYLQDFYTRQLPGAGILIIGTRWHEDDLIGRLLKAAKQDPKADQWELIHFPWMVEPGMVLPEYDDRNEGELLWPERYGYDEYERVRAGDEYTFQALYQGSPTSRSGNAIKRDWYPLTPFIESPIESISLYYDIAFSDAHSADYTWGSLKARLQDGSFLTLWQHFGKWNSNERNKELAQFGQTLKYISEKGLLPHVPITVETGIGGGVEIVRECVNTLITYGLDVASEASKGSKVIRATTGRDPYFSACQAGRTKFYTGDAFKDFGLYNGLERWINPYFAEVTKLRYKETENGLTFVGGKDDPIDAETGAHSHVILVDTEAYYDKYFR